MYLGAEEEIYLSYVQGALQYILASRDKLAQFPFGSRSAQSIIDKVMLDDSNSLNRYIMKGFGESFDDFVIICFYENHNVNFVWQLVDKPYFDYSGYPSSAQRASLDVDTFSEIINRFNGEIKRMRSHST